MFAVTLLAAVAQPGALPAAAAPSDTEVVDVAYDKLASGDNDAAVAQILAGKDAAAGDPAALINLGTAYARSGRLAEARAAYLAAMTGREHYALQLADGTWTDSRTAARAALAYVDRGRRIVATP